MSTHDGLGEVLLYSYYTVEDGNDTLVNITNSTPWGKAVKVRFVESMNSQEVLDFNLYLSPYDVWVGAVTKSANGAMLVTPDKSCTVPAIPAAGVEFRNYQYQGTSYSTGKGGPQGTDRTRTGYLEVIEMGWLYDVSSTFAPRVVGYPRERRTGQLRRPGVGMELRRHVVQRPDGRRELAERRPLRFLDHRERRRRHRHQRRCGCSGRLLGLVPARRTGHHQPVAG